MADDSVGYLFSQAMPRVAGEDVLFRDFLQNRLRLVIQRGESADFVFLGSDRGVRQPFLDFFTAPVILDVRGAADDALDREFVLVPEPAENEEGKAGAPGGGHDNMDLRAGIKDSPELLDTFRGKDVRVFFFAGV